jgi:hypothetical protein
MRFSYFVVIVAALQTSQFYQLHWPHRHLLPEAFRTLLLSKGLLKAVVYIAISLVLHQFSAPLAWVYAIVHPLLGLLMHYRWCRANGVDPVSVEPREKYVRATADWVNRLMAAQEAKRQSRHSRK